MSFVKHCKNMERSCVRCLTTMEHIQKSRGSESQIIWKAKEVWEQYNILIETEESEVQNARSRQYWDNACEAEGKLSLQYLSERGPAIDDNGFRLNGTGPEMYALFIYEPLHNLQPGILKVLNACVVLYSSSASF